jgi:hypothetical protein
MTDARDNPAEVVRRWEASGGHWRVLRRSETSVVVGLFSCDGGEEMQRLTATTADLDAFLACRTRSDDYRND